MTYCAYCMSPIEPTYKICPHCGRAVNAQVPPHHLLPGTILNGKILVGAALGEGGFGITYIGRDLNLDLKVAVKEYYPSGYVNRANTVSPEVTFSLSADGEDFFIKGKERFIKEARILARFSSEPGVVEVKDFFEANNTAYIVMEYLDGMDLKQYLRTSGVLTPEKTLELMMPVMRTLTKIHAQGLIHRDISPDNIRMSNRVTKLLDFGAARDVSSAGNKSLSVMLKPGYAPEEQYRSKGEQGPWTDVYALCATMYMCITGTAPDDATQRLFNDELKPPSALGIKISPSFEQTLMRGMAVLAKDRIQSVDELIDSFCKVGGTTPASSKAKRSNKGILICLISVLLVAAIGVGSVFLLKIGDSGSKSKKGDSVSDSSINGAEAAIKKYFEYYAKPDYKLADRYMLYDADAYVRHSAGEEGVSFDEYLTEYLGVSSLDELYTQRNTQIKDQLTADFGEDYAISVTITDTVELEGEDKEEVLTGIDDNFGEVIDVSGIEKIVDCSFDVTLTGSLEASDTDSESVYVVYINGSWKIVQ